jgi:hypothetical protein
LVMHLFLSWRNLVRLPIGLTSDEHQVSTFNFLVLCQFVFTISETAKSRHISFRRGRARIPNCGLASDAWPQQDWLPAKTGNSSLLIWEWCDVNS